LGSFPDPSIGVVDRTLTCPGGTLRIGFDPGTPVEGTHSGPWRIVSGTGAYKGWQGSGQMEFDDRPVADDDEGRETFTGTVTS
jgi:hypothetical protein